MKKLKVTFNIHSKEGMAKFAHFMAKTLNSEYNTRDSFKIGLNGLQGIGKSTFNCALTSTLTHKEYSISDFAHDVICKVPLPNNKVLYCYDEWGLGHIDDPSVTTEPFSIIEHAKRNRLKKHVDLRIRFEQKEGENETLTATIITDKALRDKIKAALKQNFPTYKKNNPIINFP